MGDDKLIRLSQAARKLNVGHNTILDFLAKKGFEVENNPNAKLTQEQFNLLSKEYASSATDKIEASGLVIGTKHTDNLTIETEQEGPKKRVEEEESIMIKNLVSKDLKTREEPRADKVERDKPKLEGIKVVGKIDLEKKTVAPAKEQEEEVPLPEEAKVEEPKAEEPEKEIPLAPEKQDQDLIKAKADKLKGLKVVDRIELPVEKKKDRSDSRF